MLTGIINRWTDSMIHQQWPQQPVQELIAGTGGPFPNSFWDPAGKRIRRLRHHHTTEALGHAAPARHQQQEHGEGALADT